MLVNLPANLEASQNWFLLAHHWLILFVCDAYKYVFVPLSCRASWWDSGYYFDFMAYEVGDFGLILPFPVGIVGFYCFHSLEWKCSSWYQSSRHALFQPVLDLFILLCFINFLPFPKYCRCKRSSCCFSTFCTDNVCQSLFCSFVTSSAHHLWTSCNFASVILEEQAS